MSLREIRGQRLFFFTYARSLMINPLCSGEACLIRFADDFVCAFEKEEDARHFYEAVGGVGEIRPGASGGENADYPL